MYDRRIRNEGLLGKVTSPYEASLLIKAGIIGKRLPYQTQEDCRNGINSGRIKYIDMNLSHVSQYINYGFLGKIDVALVEFRRCIKEN